MTRHSNVSDGDAIRLARERLKLSREGLAYKAGVSLRSIERIEGGNVTPRRSTLAVIQQALDAADPEEIAA